MTEDKQRVAQGIAALRTGSVVTQLAALRAASMSDLQQHWQTLFGTSPPAYNRRFLESRLA